jgi:hypothetical protein
MKLADALKIKLTELSREPLVGPPVPIKPW